MGHILPYIATRRRRIRPPQKGEPRGEIVIFSGVRIERERPEPPVLPRPAPVKAG
jgi:hypothetical protein